MTFQYLTIEMIEKAKTNGGYIDQTQFKTAHKYSFDTLIITDDVMAILDSYIMFARPLLNPQTDYLLSSTAGTQYQSLTTAMTMLVYEAIGKYINPPRYREIVETTSADVLSREEQECISEDQKHSSTVAKVYYKKKQSRKVALQGKQCMDKMLAASQLELSNVSVDDLISEIETFNNEFDDDVLRQSAANISFDVSPPSASGLLGNSTTSSTTMENELRDKTQEFMGIGSTLNTTQEPSNTNDNDLIITNTVSATTEVPCCSYDKEKISKSVKIKKENVSLEVKKRPLRNRKFTREEDEHLQAGIIKYGRKNWAGILKDNQFKFHESRNRDSLRMRADSATFKRLYSIS